MVDSGANGGLLLGFFFTMTPLSAFLTDASFLEVGTAASPGFGGADGFEAKGGWLLIAFSLAATALRGAST